MQTAETQSWPAPSRQRPAIIAHRGASGQRPEHTLAAYELAVQQGADFIEPDLVMTQDGVLVARHDRYLSTTTDVAGHPEFADRKTAKEGREDWWAEDFTLEEIKTLRAIQPREGRSKDYDGQFEIPAFEEILTLMRTAREGGAAVGVYPEIKHPAALAALGLDPVPAIAEALKRFGLAGEDAPVFVQSFEPDSLRRLNGLIDTKRVQLIGPVSIPGPASQSAPPLDFLLGEQAVTPEAGLARIAEYADAVGPCKLLAISSKGEATGFVGLAHAAGLPVHAWTFRDDASPPDGAAPEVELRRAFAAGLDGVFTDFPATGVRARAETAEA